MVRLALILPVLPILKVSRKTRSIANSLPLFICAVTDGHKESTIDHTKGQSQKQDVSQLERESQQRVRTRSQSASRASVERKTGKQSTERSASKKKATRNQKQGVSSRGSGKGHN